MPDPDFRDHLRAHYLVLQAQHRDMERGTPAWFDCEKAIFATARLYRTLYREAMEPIHSGPHPVRPAE